MGETGVTAVQVDSFRPHHRPKLNSAPGGLQKASFWFILRIDVVRCHTDFRFPACLSCRARKVRCDVVSQYPKSCTNCHLDQVECAVPNPKRCVVSLLLPFASTDLLHHARLTKKTNTRGPNVEIIARRSQEQDRFLTNESRPSNAMDLDTELPFLLSSDSSMTQNASSMDFVTDLNTAHVLARDGPLSSI